MVDLSAVAGIEAAAGVAGDEACQRVADDERRQELSAPAAHVICGTETARWSHQHESRCKS